MRASKDSGRLAWILGGLWLILLIPTVLLGRQALQQLRFESMHQYRLEAESVSARVDLILNRIFDAERDRPVGHYRYSNATSAASSPLSQWPQRSEIPGIVGFFQVAADGRFSTPLLPAGEAEAARPGQRLASQQMLQQLLLQSSVDDATQGIALNKAEGGAGLRREDALLGARVEAEAEKRSADSAETKKDSDQKPAAAGRSAREPRPQELAAASAPIADVAYGAAPATSTQLDSVAQNQVLFEQLATKRRGSSARKRPTEELSLQTDYFQRSQRATGAASGKGKPMTKSPPKPKQQPKAQLRDQQDELNTTTTAAQELQEMSVDLDAQADALLAPITVDALFGQNAGRLDFAALDSSHFVVFRRVAAAGSGLVQGFVVQQDEFFAGVLEQVYASSTLAAAGDLSVALGGELIYAMAASGAQPGAYSASQKVAVSGGELLYRHYLDAPLGDVEFLFSARHLPRAAGSSLVVWSLAVLVGLLCAGFVLLFLLGRRQLQQREQQQDFISAVSHELKTPLTSIRMYGEMLKSGWVTEDKKAGYYEYIFNESERLSRLINNVLQLARLNREQTDLQLNLVSISEIDSLVDSRVAAQVAAQGFTLTRQCVPELRQQRVNVDSDALVQVMINLIDNALKFSANAERKEVQLGFERDGPNLAILVRDFGPGIPDSQLRKIFRLFYRSESELTRETVGTGIGLALVSELVTAMHGEVTVTNQQPGAQFTVRLPLVGSDRSG